MPRRRTSPACALAIVALSTFALVAVRPATAAVPVPQFGDYQVYNFGSSAQSVAVGDFNSDGRNDVAAVGASYTTPDDALAILVGMPDGRLAMGQRLATDLLSTDRTGPGLAAGDLDGDGRTDLTLATGRGVDVYIQRNGALAARRLVEQAGARQVLVADVNGDGRADLVVTGSGGVVWMAGAGDGTFGPAASIAPDSQIEIEVGDVTGDGLLDVVGLATNWLVHVYAQRADGSFAAPALYPVRSAEGIAVADVTGDGRLDVAATASANWPSSGITVYPQRAPGLPLGPALDYSSYDLPGPIEAGDLNADGRLDLVTMHENWAAVGIYTQEVDGTLTRERLVQYINLNGFDPRGLAVADVTADGRNDVVIADGNEVVVLPGLPPVAATTSTSTTTTTRPVPPPRVLGWGLNHVGQVGDGTTVDRHAPTLAALAASPAPKQVSAGTFHNLALRSDGRIVAWGWNGAGQLGTGSTADSHSPVAVGGGLADVTAVAAGAYHSLALKADGTVWAWGWNAVGQLGNGTLTDSPVPVRVPGLTGIVSIAGGAYHSLAVRNDGTVWAWGWNGRGALGIGTTTDSAVPVQVAGLTGAVKVSAGLFHSLALRVDGTLRAWGWNGEGELGNGSTAMSTTPVAVRNLIGVVSFSAGWWHSLAVTKSGDVFAWGWNGVGQLGTGAGTPDRLVPTYAGNAGTGAQVSAGAAHSLTVSASSWGRLTAWGWNGAGQLGTSFTVDRPSPELVRYGVTSVSAGTFTSVAVGSA